MCSVKNHHMVNIVDLFASLLWNLSASVRMFVLHGTHQRASWLARQRDEFVQLIFIHFSDVCEDCGHVIAIHKYSFSADDQFQVYIIAKTHLARMTFSLVLS